MARSFKDEFEQGLADCIANQEVGNDVVLRFLGDPHPVGVKVVFPGGWAVEFTMAPGMEAVLTRGTNETYPVSMDVTLMPYDGLK